MDRGHQRRPVRRGEADAANRRTTRSPRRPQAGTIRSAMHVTQRLVGETPLEAIVAMARTLATQLRGEPLEFVELWSTTSEDLNGATTLFDAAWTAPGIELSVQIENGGGNPRDGWGYEIDVQLRVEPGGALAEAVEMRVSGPSGGPNLRHPTLRFTCPTMATFERASAIVRDALGLQEYTGKL